MKKLKNNTMAALLLTVASLTLASCDKENQNSEHVVPIPTETKVSRVYQTSHLVLEMYNIATGNWDTTMALDKDRWLWQQFFWTGDRLDSMLRMGNRLLFEYDNKDRVKRIYDPTTLEQYTYKYDAQGSLSRIERFEIENNDTLFGKVMDYFWADGKLSSAKNTIVATNGPYEPQGTKEELYHFSWAGENIVKSVVHNLHFNETRDTTTYNYEYTNIPNPFYGINYLQMLHNTFLNNTSPTDAFCKNMLSRYSYVEKNNSFVTTFDYTLTNGLLTAIHVVSASTNTTGTIRQKTTYDYEIEYVQD